MGRLIRLAIVFIILLSMIIPSVNISAAKDCSFNYVNQEFSNAQNIEVTIDLNRETVFPKIPDAEFLPMNANGLYNGLINYSDVLLIINNNSAISMDVGTYFAQQRGLPEINICNISTDTSNTINSATFNDLRSQIENYINWNGLKTKINFIVTTKGVPLRVDYGGGSRACVDAELMLILGTYSNRIGGSGRENNPYFNDNVRFSKETHDMYLVTRLTGYTTDEIKGYIDLATISYGQRGMFMLDVSPGRDSSPGYKIGNDWMRNANIILNNKGFNVTLDETAPFITDVENVSGYCSWGSNDGAYSTNHVSNNGLESDSDGNGVPNSWYLQKDTGDSWSHNKTEVQSGSWSMKLIRPTVNGNFSAISQNFTVQPGVRYYMAGYINISNVSGTGKGAFLQIAARDQSDNIIQYFNGTARRPNTGNFISLSQKHYEPIDGVTKITVSVVVSECSGTFYFDNIRLYEIKPHNTYIPGAIAETYVSTGGRSFNYPTSYGQSLVADMIREGVTGVKGYVYEPFLDAIAHPDILFPRYVTGYNLAESYYMASQYISWMDVVVGDPKVAPYINELAELSASIADINFSIAQPSEGDSVTITGTVHNTGKVTATNIKAQLYLGRPGAGGITLGAPKEMTIGSGQSADIQYTWDTTYLNGWYNVYLEFDFEDAAMEQLESNNLVNRTIYINAKPELSNIKLSGNTILRNQSLSVNVNGTDIETPEGQLICEGQFKYWEDTGVAAWQDFTAPTYSGQYWTFNYTANLSSKLGDYDIRIRFNDNDPLENPGISDWTTQTEVFEVTNNKPYVLKMELSDSEVFRTESVSITIEAGDLETTGEDIDCSLEIKESDGTQWKGLADPFYKNGHWETEYIPSADVSPGLYDFRVYIKDDESYPYQSDYLTLPEALLVMNNLAKVTNLSVEEAQVLRLDEVNVIISAEDIEDTDEDLTAAVEYRHNSSGSEWKVLTKFSYQLMADDAIWTTTFKPQKTATLGYYDLRARFTDMDDESEGWFNLDRALTVTNNLPAVEEIELSADQIIRNDTIFIAATGYDPEHTKSDLTCHIEVILSVDADTVGTKWQSLEITQYTNRWEGRFDTDLTTPPGFYHVRARLLDPDIVDSPSDYNLDELWKRMDNALFIRKGFPELKDLKLTPDTIKTGESTVIEISTTGNSSENDELICMVQYQDPDGQWYSLTPTYDKNKDAGVWNAVLLAEDTNQPGDYKFRVQFVSPTLGNTDWHYPETKLTVEGEPTKTDSDVSSFADDMLPILILLIVIMIAIIAVVAMLLSKKRKAKKATVTAPVHEGITMEAQGEWQTPEQVLQAQAGFTQDVMAGAPVVTAEAVYGLPEPVDAEIAALPAASGPFPEPVQEPLVGELMGPMPDEYGVEQEITEEEQLEPEEAEVVEEDVPGVDSEDGSPDEEIENDIETGNKDENQSKKDENEIPEQ